MSAGSGLGTLANLGIVCYTLATRKHCMGLGL